MINGDIFMVREENIEGLEETFTCKHCGGYQTLLNVFRNDGFCFHCDVDTDGILYDLCSLKEVVDV